MSAPLLGLLEEGKQRGFLGPGPVEDHLDHARAFSVAVDSDPGRAVDLGAGGGVPGLVLASVAWPATQWVLLDAQLKRTEFLAEAVRTLGLEHRVTVVTERAEVLGRDPAHRAGYDLVVARSFGQPAVLAECAAPLLGAAGCLVVSEPPDTTPADRWPAAPLDELGLEKVAGFEGTTPVPYHLVRIALTGRCPDRYPRRVGIPAKRPLF